MSTIEDLEREVKSLSDQLHDAQQKLGVAKLDACPIKIGMTVEGTGRHVGEYRVVEIDTRWNPPWLIGNPKRKDGSWGNARRNLFDDYKLAHESQ